MKGEFDKDDGGWGPVGTWKPFEEQIANVIKAAARVIERKDKEARLMSVREQLEQLVKYKGKKLSDTGPLGAWLWQKEKECAVRRDEAQEKEKKAGRLQKGKWRKEGKDLDQDRRGWSELAVWWQSIERLNKDEGKPSRQHKVRSDSQPTSPPPYAPPSAPLTVGIYPTIQLTEGKLHIDDDPDSDWTVSQQGSDADTLSTKNRPIEYTPQKPEEPETDKDDPFVQRRHTQD
ncbi:hypothetical protein D5F01_LYC01256 [Larimichthys crocea]|uniref:Uncharacterized protein n=1 Tax=Larimichthys crocea TaxID=215358 RepID=A0A6G0JBW8_LARCR|nr:hypothetical protein D5F01_LYC01256 [Larimichthys crocea]